MEEQEWVELAGACEMQTTYMYYILISDYIKFIPWWNIYFNYNYFAVIPNW